MAYLRDIAHKCGRCMKNATVELVNNRNAAVGRFCWSCGQKELAAQKAREKAAGERSG